MRQLRERFEILKNWRVNEELPPSEELFRCVMKLSEEASHLHRAYHHYSSIDAVLHIFGKGNPSWRLTRLTSLKLNDHNECDKFAGKDEAQKTYIASFCHDGSENANLWWLYAKGNPKAIRLTFSASAIAKWMDSMRVKNALLADVVYAAVSGRNDPDSFERRNVLGWSDVRISVDGLSKFLQKKGVAGRLKDYEWRDESETRIILRSDKGLKYEHIPVPMSIIPELRITLSPWAKDRDVKCVREKLEGFLGPYGWRPTRTNFRNSVLTGAMDALRNERIGK